MVITKIWNGIHSKCRREKQDRDFTGASSGYDSTPAESTGSAPGQGTKVPRASQPSQKSQSEGFLICKMIFIFLRSALAIFEDLHSAKFWTIALRDWREDKTNGGKISTFGKSLELFL